MQRSATWVFTINNYQPADIERLTSLDKERYVCVFGEEVGEKGTPHLQGYLRADLRIRRAQVEKVLGGHAWCEVTHDEESAIGYSIKDCVIHSNQWDAEEREVMRRKVRRAKEVGREIVWLASCLENAEQEDYTTCHDWYEYLKSLGHKYTEAK